MLLVTIYHRHTPDPHICCHAIDTVAQSLGYIFYCPASLSGPAGCFSISKLAPAITSSAHKQHCMLRQQQRVFWKTECHDDPWYLNEIQCLSIVNKILLVILRARCWVPTCLATHGGPFLPLTPLFSEDMGLSIPPCFFSRNDFCISSASFIDPTEACPTCQDSRCLACF